VKKHAVVYKEKKKEKCTDAQRQGAKKKSRIREQGDRKKLTRATVQEGQTNS